MKSRIFLKLLLSFLCSITLLFIIIFSVINYSFKQGFIQYQQQSEIRLVSNMVPFLSSHFADQQSWELMRQNHSLWSKALLSANIVPPPSHPPNFVLAHEKHNKARPKINSGVDHFEPHLALRISLYDHDKRQVFGPPWLSSDGHWEEIYAKEKLVGFIHLDLNDFKGDHFATSFIEQQQQNFIYIAIIIIIFSTILAGLWARFLKRPINSVTKAFKLLASGKHDTRVDVTGSDEFTQLAINFNQMAQRLERNEVLRGQWLTDISHELRTPVSVIRGEIEALLDGIRQPTNERIHSLYEETNGLAELINDLHLLSMADNQSLKLQLAYCDPCPLIVHQIQLFTLRMKKKGLTLSFKNALKNNIKLYIDPRRISQVFNNLLENSLRYTDQQGFVEVKISTQEDQFIFSICDSAPGVNDDDLSKIFDRLYCANKSRSRSVGGSGLGLAICKSIINAHQGSIFAEHNNDGLCVNVQLPFVHHSMK